MHENETVSQPSKELTERDAAAHSRKSAEPAPLYLIPEELVRALMDRLQAAREPASRNLQSVLNSPLLIAVVGIGGIIVGGALTAGLTYEQKLLDYKLASQQQERDRREKISDEVDKLRIQKVGEVWERLDQDELAIGNLLEESKFQSADQHRNMDNNGRTSKITNLVNNDEAMLSKYRFWLGEDQFHKAGAYLKANVRYSLNELGASPDNDSSELAKAREGAKTDILKVRKEFFRD